MGTWIVRVNDHTFNRIRGLTILLRYILRLKDFVLEGLGGSGHMEPKVFRTHEEFGVYLRVEGFGV